MGCQPRGVLMINRREDSDGAAGLPASRQMVPPSRSGQSKL